MTIDELIQRERNARTELLNDLGVERDNMAAITARMRREGKSATEDPAYIAHKRRAAELEPKIEAANETIDRLIGEAREDERADALARESHPGAPSPWEDRAPTIVTYEASQYRAQDAKDGKPTFLADLYAAQIKRDPAAGERLARHGREVESRADWNARAVTTGAVAGFTPPAYLTDLFAELARAGRPVANLCTRMPLPDHGMTVNVPRVTTGTTTGVQTSENATVSNQDLDDTLLTVDVRTIAGYVDVSRQAIERGIGVETLVMTDLASDYNARLDTQVINGSGASGQHLGILNTTGITTVTYTDATPTVPELWPKLADAVRQITSQRFTGATGIVMTPLTWGWMLAEKDSTGRPLIDTNGTGFNAAGTANAPQYEGAAGELFGVPVYLSGNMPSNLGAGTNETRIVVADFRDIVLFEDPSAAPAQLRFDEPLSNSLGVRLIAYGYSAFTAGRQPKAVSVVAGTGLILPSL